MKYTFSPATDFEKLAAAIAGLYGSAAGRNIECVCRHRRRP